MDVFATLKNEKFFNPLTGSNKRIYFDCITELIEYAKTTSILYETNIRDHLELYLENKQYHVEDDELELNINDQDSIKIIRKFRECGWLTIPELGRNGEYITNITPSCRKVIDFLNRLSNKKNDAAISNKILTMYEILQNTFIENSIRKDRPYSSVIVPLVDAESELKDEVLDLKDSISIIQSKITEIDNLSNFGNYLLADAFLDKFFSDYFYMKNNGLIPSILKSIADQLRRFKEDILFEKAVKEYQESNQIDYDSAKDKLSDYIDEIFYYITVEYIENMEDIDASINKYYRLANLRIKLVKSEGLNVQSAIDTMLTAVKEADRNKKEELMNGLQNCVLVQSQKYISRKSYQRKKRQVNENNTVEMQVVELSDEELAKITNDLMENAMNPYSIERTNAYFHHLFKETSLPVIKSKYVKNKEDALMFASAFIYSGEKEFDFVVDAEEGYETTSVADISNMSIRRKK